VKFEVTKVSKYPNVSCADLTITNEFAAQTGVNLAAGKTVTATTSYNNTASRLTDGSKDPKTGRWMTEQAAPQSATVDLGSSQTMDRFVVTWENAANAGKDFKLYVSDNKDNMGDPVASVTGNKDAVSTVKLKAPKAGRYVKLEVLGMNGPYGVSCCELEAYNGEAKPQVDPTVNLAQGKTAQADSVEDNATSTLGAPKAFDGDKATRWSSGNDATASKDGGPHWVYVDLGQETPVKGIRINWHQRKAKGYKIQVATGDSAPETNSDAWKTVYTNNGHPSKKDDAINLQEATTARFVRLYIDHNTYNDPDNGVAWGCVGVNEMEVFAGDVPAPSKTPA
ncbi:MAG: discoidin domain-containing protein, partial [Coriobacteriaceae bacterium]|nr:discoidin domain-containing protein [Coriobacteriaceae bacterium]